MHNSIGAAKRAPIRCAVFKIDLKGRFVYIDDDTEELLGFSRDELFGRSIYEFISDSSSELMRSILHRYNRYESFYETISLNIQTDGSEERSLKAVITLNFIAGNPGSYQLIIIPESSDDVHDRDNNGRDILKLLTQKGELNLEDVARIFCNVGGFREAICYFPDKQNGLISRATYPGNFSEHSAPSYIEDFFNKEHDSFGMSAESGKIGESLPDREGETAILLRYGDADTLVLHLCGLFDSSVIKNNNSDLKMFVDIWNRFNSNNNRRESIGDSFSLAGEIAGTASVGLAITLKEGEIVYRNRYLSELLSSSGGDHESIPESEIVKLIALLEGKDRIKSNGFQHRLPSGQRIVIHSGTYENPDASMKVYFFLPSRQSVGNEESDNSHRKLIRSIAHDLKAPLITIDAFTRRLQAYHINNLDDKGKFAVNCLLENSRILQDMIEGLGLMSNNWETEPEPELISVAEIINDLIKYMKAAYPGKEYTVELDETFPDVVAPQSRLIQLFRNILDNAFKYLAETEKPKIRILYYRENDCHRFSIIDNGPGIPASYKKKIFEPFFRIPDTGKEPVPGSGMGLAIARDIVISWGGKIWVDTTRKKGSATIFTLPLENEVSI